MNSVTDAARVAPPRGPVPDIGQMREAAMVAAMRGHLAYAEDEGRWLANGADRWHYVDDSAVEAFFAHPGTEALVMAACLALAGEHYRRTMARLGEWRGKCPAAFIAEIEPFVRARAELDITRDELNAIVRHYAEQHKAKADDEESRFADCGHTFANLSGYASCPYCGEISYDVAGRPPYADVEAKLAGHVHRDFLASCRDGYEAADPLAVKILLDSVERCRRKQAGDEAAERAEARNAIRFGGYQGAYRGAYRGGFR
jgi:hypothetical protein